MSDSDGQTRPGTALQASFGRWQLADVAGEEASGVVQVKVFGDLVTYPSGRSAMLWYGAGASMADLVRTGVEAAASDYPRERLRWRSLELAAPEAVCSDLLARFKRRFGSPPRSQPPAV